MKFLIVVLACLFNLSLMAQNKTLDNMLEKHKGKEGISEIEELLLKGINATDSDAWTALMIASRYGYTDIVETLIEAGAKVNIKIKEGSTALFFASLEGHTKIVRILIKADADVNIKNKYGYTALMWASRNGYTEIVKVLIDTSVTSLRDTGSASTQTRRRAARAELNVKEKDGFTALILASESGHTEIAQALISEGADVNIKNKYGWTALMYASEKGRTDIVEALIESGAKVNIKSNNGYTALMAASKFGHTEIVKLLKKTGAK